ncbi:polyphosphate kinase 1 [Limnobacter litoralis]|uniref:Polyphosphate kinase n=2 Tax=Limnobacter TaxID=131079 RepID=A0ABQ5YU11_9BURK|nr:polyphosphate kinase 1 [Limnobacter litoralis]GLR26932.1 polyphosphate kinase [Limnobacter litoralis]
MLKVSPVSDVQPNKELYLNRELGVLAFNRRVLAMAQEPHIPLLERLRYLCIVSSNLDEFFEIRVAGLQEQIRQNPDFFENDGMTVAETLRRVSQEAQELVDLQYRLLNQEVMPALKNEGIVFLTTNLWNEEQAHWAKQYFKSDVLPVLTPIGLDPAHPFPRVLNKSLNFAVELSGNDAFGRASRVGIVQAPRALPRLVRMPQAISGHPHAFVLLTSIMQAFVPDLFPGMEVHGVYQFRVTRNSDLYVDEEEITNLRVALQGELSQRHFGDAVRLEVSDQCSESMVRRLLKEFNLNEQALYRVNGPVNLVRLMQVPDLIDRPDLKFMQFTPGLPAALNVEPDIFAAIQKGDVLLHHPYQSFNPVLEFIKRAAQDPHVVAIKQTIYRTGTDSALMEMLLAAARSGKEVTVVLELMARFDEEANIQWASKLEQVGAHVIYGVVGQKTHAKMLMVVRREKSNGGKTVLRRYVHLGTGNYHPRTARLYTDFGLFSCDDALGQDVHEVFNHLTGLGRAKKLNKIWNSPFNLHANVVAAIRKEADNAREGKKARIMARMNALLEPHVINELYAASQAGVKIDLIVRGVCTLRPGVPGLSEHITVRSVVGRLLEHSRVFYFYNGGQEDVFISSADWMDRNFFRRVELAVPITDRRLKKRVLDEGLKVLLADNLMAWGMHSDGSYTRKKPTGKRRVHAQLQLLSNLTVNFKDPLLEVPSAD